MRQLQRSTGAGAALKRLFAALSHVAPDYHRRFEILISDSIRFVAIACARIEIVITVRARFSIKIVIRFHPFTVYTSPFDPFVCPQDGPNYPSFCTVKGFAKKRLFFLRQACALFGSIKVGFRHHLSLSFDTIDSVLIYMITFIQLMRRCFR